MIRVLFVVIGAILGQGCASRTQVSCDATLGCGWTYGTGNCSGPAPYCDGASTCAGLNSSKCNSESGCSYVTASEGGCVGTASCGAQTTIDGCNALGGCLWNESTADNCVGAPSKCSGTSEADCRLDGCTYTAEATPSACTQSRSGHSTIECEDAINQASCELLTSSIGCEWKDVKPAHCRLEVYLTCDDINFIVEDGGIMCTEVPGCTYSGNVGTCIGGTINKTCAEFSHWDCLTVGCRHVQVGECLPNPCDRHNYDEEGCNATAGCTYSSEGNICRGTPLPTSECGYVWRGECEAFGCTWITGNNISGDVYECAGDVKFKECEEWDYGDSTCTVLGCTSTGVVEGNCSGTVDRSLAVAATTEESCTALGEALYRWYYVAEGGCECEENCSSSSKRCSDFTTSGNEICYSLGCTWTPGVAQGCTGTPTNTGKDCVSLTSDGNETCTGNQCTWILEGEKTCTGTAIGKCSDETEATCGTIGGCTYIPATTATCAGTNSGFCSGGTYSPCRRVNGCIWTEDCSRLDNEWGCGHYSYCTWNQPGTCDSTGNFDIPVYASVLAVLLLALFY